MPGSGTEERENREVVFRIGGGEHIQVITEIITLPVGIPSDITVRLAVGSVASAVADAVFQAAAGTFFTFLCGGINRSAIPSKGKIKKVNQPVIYRLVKEKHFEDLIKPFTGSHVLRRMEFKLFKEILYGYFLDRRCFFPFLLRLFGFFLWRVDGIGKVVFVREP